MSSPRPIPGPVETESGYMDVIIDWAHIRGWHVAHFRAAQTSHGWRTPVQADGKGWPDLFLLRPPRAVAAEVKRDARTERAREKQIEPDQARWHELFHGCPGVEFYLWRPADWPDVERILR